MTARVRLVQVALTPQFVIDDGDTLTPLPPQQWTVPAGEWPDIHAKVTAAVADLESRLEHTAPGAPTAT